MGVSAKEINGQDDPSNHKKKQETSRLVPGKDEEDKKKAPKVSYSQLFRFADKKDYAMLLLGSVCALINGVAFPGNILIYSEMLEDVIVLGKFANLLEMMPGFLMAYNFSVHDAFVHTEDFEPYCDVLYLQSNGTVDCEELNLEDNIMDSLQEYALRYLGIAMIVALCAATQVYTFMQIAQRQVIRLRQACFRNILRQEMAWFDEQKVGGLTVKMTEDIDLIHAALGDHMAAALQWYSTCITGVVISFTYGWELCLVMLSVTPIVMGSASIAAKVSISLSAQERDAYAAAGAIAEEVFSSIRTVVAFGGQEKEAERYANNLVNSKRLGIRKGFVTGMWKAAMGAALFFGYALGFYYGGKLVREGDYTIKDLMAVSISAIFGASRYYVFVVWVFYTSFLGAVGLGFAVPAMDGINTGRAAAFKVYQILERTSLIDSSSYKGKRPNVFKGQIQFRDVWFSYPTRRDVQVLSGLNLRVDPGQTVAFVGSSGCGKSTAVQLIQRFYDIDSGTITIDNNDIRELNLRWIRQHIGVVSQEPTLFGATIAENIRLGKEGASMDEIIQACKDANAYDFIMKLPKKFDTYVGERGAQLSGGQKQRIAIARALVKDPKMLLLDEATSALDTASESIVQEALDKASQGRTTIVIAHRLSTIRHADVIVVLDRGKVSEQGTHDELIVRKGLYFQLVNAQTHASDNQFTTTDEEGAISDGELQKRAKMAKSLTKKDTFDDFKRMKSIEEIEEEIVNTVTKGEATKRLFVLNRPELPIMLAGALVSLLNGAIDPIFGIIFAEVTKALAEPVESEQRRKMNDLSMLATFIGVGCFVVRFLQDWMFAISGESLTKRIREILFRAMLKQNITWFDKQSHETAILTSRLSNEASQVQVATGVTMGLLMQCIGTLLVGLGAALYYGWQLALIVLCIVPLMVLSGMCQVRVIKGQSARVAKTMEEATSYAMQAVTNIRTVASLTREDRFIRDYGLMLEQTTENSTRTCLVVGGAYGLSQCIYYLSFAITYYFGGMLVESNDIKFYNMFRVFSCMAVSASNMGRWVAFAPDTAKAREAAVKIFTLADDTPAITETGLTPSEWPEGGQIRFSDVTFHYPARSDVTVLNGLNLDVRQGQTLALVGESGCGKSTTVQLLERFYDPVNGAVYLGKHELRDLNPQWVRSHMGLVSQEPVLFDRTLAENIAYGDNSREVYMQEIIQAAREANIHNFIQNLPQGYETNVGSKGTQLSGGQKQRVAIARALIRKPKILLLDEATSALDTESEKIVQEALDRARQGRTCIVIAHRLSTIQDADEIAVFKAGKIHERGTHSQLMANHHSLYYQLQRAQSGKR